MNPWREFQNRRVEDMHMSIQLESAPKVGNNKDSEIIAFFDLFITCFFPAENKYLAESRKVSLLGNHHMKLK